MNSQFGEKTERVKVPTEDASNWIRTLQEAGFSGEEIDSLMIHLNDEYAVQKLHRYIEAEIQMIRKEFLDLTGGEKEMTLEQERALRTTVLEQLRELTKEELRRGKRYKSDT